MPSVPASSDLAPPPRPAPRQRPPSRRRPTWSQLLRRVLDLYALSRPRCSTPMVVLAPVYRTCHRHVLSCSLHSGSAREEGAPLTDSIVIRKILDHLRLPTDLPPLAPARCPDDEPIFYTGDSTDEHIDGNRTIPSRAAPACPCPSVAPGRSAFVARASCRPILICLKGRLDRPARGAKGNCKKNPRRDRHPSILNSAAQEFQPYP